MTSPWSRLSEFVFAQANFQYMWKTPERKLTCPPVICTCKKKNHFARTKFSELVFFNPYSLFILPLPNWYLLTYYNLHRPQSQILVKKKKKNIKTMLWYHYWSQKRWKCHERNHIYKKVSLKIQGIQIKWSIYKHPCTLL